MQVYINIDEMTSTSINNDLGFTQDVDTAAVKEGRVYEMLQQSFAPHRLWEPSVRVFISMAWQIPFPQERASPANTVIRMILKTMICPTTIGYLAAALRTLIDDVTEIEENSGMPFNHYSCEMNSLPVHLSFVPISRTLCALPKSERCVKKFCTSSICASL